MVTSDCSGGVSKSSFRTTQAYLFIKLTMYTMRGVQIMGWSVRMALMACFTQNSGLNGGRNGSISFLTRPGERKEGENMMIKSGLCLIKSAQSAPPVRASHYRVETDPACTFYSSGSPYCVHENPSWQWHERPQAKLPWLLLSNVYSNQIRIVSFALLVAIWNPIVTFGRLLSLTLFCILWTCPCPPGKDTPASSWYRPSPKPWFRGSRTRGSRWHRTCSRSNPETERKRV